MKKITVVMGMILAMLVIMVFPSYGQVINGCYQKNNGQLRILASGDACRPSEVAIQWNQKGDKGDTGATGATGAQGPPGVANGITTVIAGSVNREGIIVTHIGDCETLYVGHPPNSDAFTYQIQLTSMTDPTPVPQCVVHVTNPVASIPGNPSVEFAWPYYLHEKYMGIYFAVSTRVSRMLECRLTILSVPVLV